MFELKRRTVTLANSGLPYPVRCTKDGAEQVVLPGVPLGSFAASSYDEISFDLAAGDIYVFCSDGVFEANDAAGGYFGVERVLEVVTAMRGHSAREVADAIFGAVQEFRGNTLPADDMTAVAIKMTA